MKSDYWSPGYIIFQKFVQKILVDSIDANRFKVRLNYLSQINEVEFIVAELLDHPVFRLKAFRKEYAIIPSFEIYEYHGIRFAYLTLSTGQHLRRISITMIWEETKSTPPFR